MTATIDGPLDKATLRRVIAASTMGTAFEGYDYFCFGALSLVLSRHFFSGVDEASAVVFTLLTFAVGFVTRPIGAVLFGRLGDRRGRKGAFLATILLMGGATVAIGLLPTYEDVGVLATALLVGCRLLQGLALGPGYGGAIIYVAEHAPVRSRGFNASWIQTTGAIGLVTALAVIFTTRTLLGEAAFEAWGWRVPFLLSSLLLIVSIWMRARLGESPVFEDMRRRKLSTQRPMKETLLHWPSLKLMLLVLFALMAATGVIFYAGQFYAQFFLERICRLEPARVNMLILIATVVGAPLTLFFGWLSDRLGRKPVILFGMVLMLAAYMPAYRQLAEAANPQLFAAQARAPVTVIADRGECAVQFNLMGTAGYLSSCDVAKRALADAGLGYRVVEAPRGTMALIRIGAEPPVSGFDGAGLPKAAFEARYGRLKSDLRQALDRAGYPAPGAPAPVNDLAIVSILVLLISACAAISGPSAAALAELFPAHIRYMAVSLPYHIGLGWFGGFMPAIAFATIAATGDVYSGVWYPFAVTALSLILAIFFLPETRGRDLAAVPRSGGRDGESDRR